MKTFTPLLLGCLCCCIRSMGQDTAVQLKDVVVTGQYQAQSVKQSIYRVRTISSERIQLRGATDVLAY
jgi:outer membrane receptor for ferrienterochelin and colicins